MADMPEVGEIVVCKINKVLDYGVFVELLEYENLQGFVHISQVASSWIKNIRNFVKENQIRVGQITRIDSSKNQIDVSFIKISPTKEREKIDEFRLFKRQQKLVELIADEKKSDFDTAWDKVAEPLLAHYDNLIEAFENVVSKGEAAAKDVPKEWLPALISVVGKNIEVPQKTVSGDLKLGSLESDGIDTIKAVLSELAKTKGKGISISYLGAGKYHVKATAEDYKAAEKILDAVAEKAVDFMKKHKGTASFERS